MNNKRKNSDVSPYDLNQIGKIKTTGSGVARTRSRSDDPYSTSSSAYVIKDNLKTSNRNK